MTGMEMIGPIMGMAGKAAQAGGGKGGGGGSSGPSPEQAALAQYHLGQNLLAARSGFANTGTGASTMSTQTANSARFKFAKEMAKASNANDVANAQANTQLQQLAQQNQENQGFQAGSGGFGSQSGSFGSSSDTSSTG